MSGGKDFLRAEITRQLAPALVEAGFVRFQPKTFLRRRGDLLHSLSFHGSWSGGATFSMVHSASLLCDPLFTMHGMQVGDVHQRAPLDEPYVPWAGPNAEAAEAAIASATRVAREIVLPWLDGIADLRGFVFAYIANPNNGIDDLPLAVALARAGEQNRPWWTCERLSPKVPDGPDHDFERKRRERALQLQSALSRGTVPELLDGWRDQAIAAHKLGAVPDRG